MLPVIICAPRLLATVLRYPYISAVPLPPDPEFPQKAEPLSQEMSQKWLLRHFHSRHRMSAASVALGGN